MRVRAFDLVVIAFALAAGTIPITAHHAFAAQYDINKPIELKGVVTRVEFLNPHIYFYIDVRDESGNAAHWSVEGGTPNSLRRAGWGKDSLKVGDVVTISGSRAKDGTNLVAMHSLILADGRKVLGSYGSQQTK